LDAPLNDLRMSFYIRLEGEWAAVGRADMGGPISKISPEGLWSRVGAEEGLMHRP